MLFSHSSYWIEESIRRRFFLPVLLVGPSCGWGVPPCCSWAVGAVCTPVGGRGPQADWLSGLALTTVEGLSSRGWPYAAELALVGLWCLPGLPFVCVVVEPSRWLYQSGRRCWQWVRLCLRRGGVYGKALLSCKFAGNLKLLQKESLSLKFPKHKQT